MGGVDCLGFPTRLGSRPVVAITPTTMVQSGNIPTNGVASAIKTGRRSRGLPRASQIRNPVTTSTPMTSGSSQTIGETKKLNASDAIETQKANAIRPRVSDNSEFPVTNGAELDIVCTLTRLYSVFLFRRMASTKHGIYASQSPKCRDYRAR